MLKLSPQEASIIERLQVGPCRVETLAEYCTGTNNKQCVQVVLSRLRRIGYRFDSIRLITLEGEP